MEIDEFVEKHGFADTPAGERMKADLLALVDTMYPDDELMSPEELQICADLGEMNQRICGIMGRMVPNDHLEVMLHIHALQNMVMSVAARNAFPQSFRQLGERPS